ncbi:hypothetical protein PR048_029433 [Dryococelus australis]|uniref:Uncharacterized protein n=1 Tax=Dryococelus australis TaxID=614101 RepID=A0ABQ9GDF8_9NEOP|nr:hypothetical protein PR048_029433 [Dryococelus australis]
MVHTITDTLTFKIRLGFWKMCRCTCVKTRVFSTIENHLIFLLRTDLRWPDCLACTFTQLDSARLLPVGPHGGVIYETPVESEEGLLVRIVVVVYLGRPGIGDRVYQNMVQKEKQQSGVVLQEGHAATMTAEHTHRPVVVLLVRGKHGRRFQWLAGFLGIVPLTPPQYFITVLFPDNFTSVGARCAVERTPNSSQLVNRARWRGGKLWNSHSGGRGFKSRDRPTRFWYYVVPLLLAMTYYFPVRHSPSSLPRLHDFSKIA